MQTKPHKQQALDLVSEWLFTPALTLAISRVFRPIVADLVGRCECSQSCSKLTLFIGSYRVSRTPHSISAHMKLLDSVFHSCCRASRIFSSMPSARRKCSPPSSTASFYNFPPRARPFERLILQESNISKQTDLLIVSGLGWNTVLV